MRFTASSVTEMCKMKVQRRWALLRFLITAAALFVLWVVFTADISLFSLGAGLTGSLLVAALTYAVFIPDHQANLRFFLPRLIPLLVFLPKMLYLLYRSSVIMLVAVVRGEASPRIVYFRTTLRSDIARAVLASSITFTPGTITLDLNDDHLIVHWFFSDTTHAKLAGERVKGSLERTIADIWL